jgi:protein associated with RNAse G/E
LNRGLVKLPDGTFGKHPNPAKPPQNKYKVAPKAERTYNGNVYASKLEMEYRKYLDVLLKAGEVIEIMEQVPFPVILKGKKICRYELDFEVLYPDGTYKYIDVKGYTKGAAYSMFRLKKKLVECIYDIKITEITRKDFKNVR